MWPHITLASCAHTHRHTQTQPYTNIHDHIPFTLYHYSFLHLFHYLYPSTSLSDTHSYILFAHYPSILTTVLALLHVYVKCFYIWNTVRKCSYIPPASNCASFMYSTSNFSVVFSWSFSLLKNVEWLISWVIYEFVLTLWSLYTVCY